MLKRTTLFRLTLFSLLFVLFFSAPQCVMGQWSELNGPSGGGTGDIVSLNNALFVATGPGGVFKSQNQGATWSPVNNGIPVNENIGNLTEDNGALYVTVTRRGIFKSVDSGENWIQISNGIANTTFGALLVDGNQIYAGNNSGGITFSSNGGDTWTLVEENIEGIQFQDFETFGEKVLAAGRPLFVSMNNGVSWESIEIPGLGLNGARALLAVGNAFFVADDGHVFRSEDDLQTWTQLNLQTSATISNLIQFGDRIFATTSQGRYYFSDNNGDSWSLLQNELTNDFVTSVFNDENQIIMSTGEGLFSSEDAGATWNVAHDGLNAQIIEEVYVNENNVFAGSALTGIFRLNRSSGGWLGINAGLDAPNARTIHKILENDSGLFLATGGGVYFSSDNGDNWERRLDPGINGSIQVLETSNDIFLAGPGPNGLGLYISNDNGNEWVPIDIDILTVPTGYETMYFEGNDVIVGTSSGEIYLSRDLADSWTNISINLPGFFFPQDIVLIDGIIYVATARGIVFSEDYGSTWNFFKNFFLSTTELEVNAGTFYATTSNGFYATNDNLDEWLPFNEGLDLRPQRSLFIADTELFLGTFGSSTWGRPISEIVLPDGPSPEDAFITTWKTDNPGGVDDRTIAIPVSNQASFDFDIDWGDGSSNENITNSISHTYTEPGVYEVTITGRFPRIEFADQLQLIEVNQWGTTQWTSMNSAFSRCENLDVVAMDVPDLSAVFATTGMFLSCTSLVGNARFNDWDLSNVVSTASMFGGAISFNQDIGNWNTSNVQIMAGMFVLATSFNQDISNWDVSKVDLMSAMFEQATSFNQDIGKWNVSNVTGMRGMFNKATAFDQDLGDWDLSAIEAGGFRDLVDMFLDAGLSTENYDATLIGWANLDENETRIPQDITFNGGNSQFCLGEEARQNLIDNFGWTITDGGRSVDCIDSSTTFITTWKTDNPGSSEDNQITIPTFPGETYNYTVDWGDGTIETITTDEPPTHTYAVPGTFTVQIAGDFPRIFFNNEGDRFKIRTVEQWGDIAWTSMANAFHGVQVIIVAADTPNLSGVSNMSSMFEGSSAGGGSSSFGLWDVSTVTDMSRMFFEASFNQDIGGWNVSNVITMESMFSNTFFNRDIGNWDVSSVTNMSRMFNGNERFNQDIGAWDVSSVTDMSRMFVRAFDFNQDIGNWDVSSVIDMSGMFVDTFFNGEISSWDVSSVTNMTFMFFDGSFDQDLGDWDISNLSSARDMFSNSLSVANYDSIIQGWLTLDNDETRIPQNIEFGAGSSRFCFSQEARQNLIDTFGWTITDGGLDPSCPLNATLSVTSFNLIDADNDVVLAQIENGDQININDLPTFNLNIQAVATDDVESVRLELTGPQSNGRTENVAPYALFGDSSGNYAGNVFPLGDYGLLATPYSGNSLRGTMGTALDISFSFVDEDPLCEGKSAEVISITDITQCDSVGGTVLIGLENFEATLLTIFGVVDRLSPNPESNVDYDGPSGRTDVPLEVFNITNLPGPGEYRAEIFDVNGCSVEVFFTLNGPELPEVSLAPFDAVLDTDAPFVLTGGSPEGGVYSGEGVTEGVFDPGIGAGSYEITYTFTNEATNCTNSATQVLTVNPSVSSNSILGFVLVDADTNEDIGPITEGTVFDLASLPANLNIRAEATDDVESVFMEISGGITANRRENVAPYALFGDRNGDYFGRGFATGSFTVSATPYTGNNLRGEMGNILSINFSIGIPLAAQNPIDLSIYPNPTTSSVMASFEEEVTVDRIQVFDVQGRLIRTYEAKRVKDGEGYRLDVNDMPAGSYFIRTQDTKGFNYQKQLVIER